MNKDVFIDEMAPDRRAYHKAQIEQIEALKKSGFVLVSIKESAVWGQGDGEWLEFVMEKDGQRVKSQKTGDVIVVF